MIMSGLLNNYKMEAPMNAPSLPTEEIIPIQEAVAIYKSFPDCEKCHGQDIGKSCKACAKRSGVCQKCLGKGLDMKKNKPCKCQKKKGVEKVKEKKKVKKEKKPENVETQMPA